MSLQTDNPTVTFPQKVRVLSRGAPVKYGDGDSSYEGYKHKCVVLTGEEYPPTVTMHNSQQLEQGIYDFTVEMVPEGKIKTRNHFIFNQAETAALNKK